MNVELLPGYMNQIQRFAALSFEEEQALALRWKNERDEKAFHRLMQSYLRLVVKVALSYRGYGLSTDEMIQEGNIGLMQAIARFDPSKGFRLSTYAMWWIKAGIQEYILNNWSLVKIGTSSNQKKLFFNLRRLRGELLGESSSHLAPDAIATISKQLGVSQADVIGMDQRLRHGDESLNKPMGHDNENEHEWQDFIPEVRPNAEERYSAVQLAKLRRDKLTGALNSLGHRERAIFIARHLRESEDIPTLDALSVEYGVSRERVRQLEERAYKKVQKHLQLNA